MRAITAETRIGFVGLGGMGGGIVKNLVEKGRAVSVIDRSKDAVDRAVGFGAVPAQDLRALATASDVLMFCVSTAEDVEELVLGEGGALAAMQPGSVLIDHTTTRPETVEKFAAACARAGVTFIEAPLTRTPRHAWIGKINILLGASEADREVLQPIFSCYAENVFHIGEVGKAIRLKLIHNYIAFANVASWCEGFALAAKEGLDLKKLYDIISAAGANSGMLQLYGMDVLNGDFSPVMSLANAQKDVRYYVRWAESVGLPAFLGEAVHQSYVLASTMGHGQEGCQAVIKPLERLLGVEARLDKN
jgi:3-hydroxyisobutyrate dehydrogenase-like beta-hydroxyacid dehydrogenase